jgi:hypothetical protein
MGIDTKADFRTRRFKLPKEAFAVAPEVDPVPSDQIAEHSWRSIVALPDDVSIRTTDFHGSTFQRADQVFGRWVSLLLDLQSLVPKPPDDALCLAAILLIDELQASTYACLTGFYRQAISGLRFGLEAIAAGVYFRARPDPARIAEWADGLKEGQLWMADIRGFLSRVQPYSRFESPGQGCLLGADGWIAFLYKRLSAFSHGRPSLTDEDGNRIPTCNVELWGGSNGPVYETRSVRMWSVYFMGVALCCLLLVGLAEPAVVHLQKPTDLPYGDFVQHLVGWQVALHPVAPRIIEYLASV